MSLNCAMEIYVLLPFCHVLKQITSMIIHHTSTVYAMLPRIARICCPCRAVGVSANVNVKQRVRPSSRGALTYHRHKPVFHISLYVYLPTASQSVTTTIFNVLSVSTRLFL